MKYLTKSRKWALRLMATSMIYSEREDVKRKFYAWIRDRATKAKEANDRSAKALGITEDFNEFSERGVGYILQSEERIEMKVNQSGILVIENPIVIKDELNLNECPKRLWLSAIEVHALENGNCEVHLLIGKTAGFLNYLTISGKLTVRPIERKKRGS